jgi:hypothetical protein
MGESFDHQGWRFEIVDLVPTRALRAILIPVNGAGNHVTLGSRRYRMRFRMDRPRWSTTEAPDEDNRYRDEATIVLTA